MMGTLTRGRSAVVSRRPDIRKGMSSMDVLEWLLDSDPAIRWQVLRDLADEPEEVFERERSRVAAVGLGAELLALQQPAGGWGVPSPTTYHETPDGSATHVLALLLDFGLDPASEPARTALGRVRDRVTHYHDGQRYFDGEVEPCINGRVVAAGAYFGQPCDGVVERLLGEQLEDGGWNCEAPPSTRSSFHSTICVLEGLLQYERANGPVPGVSEARLRGQAYLLERGMLRSRSTGAVIDSEWLRFAYPCGYHYDVLRGLDYLWRAGASPDDRVAEAVELVRRNRGDDGRWPLQVSHADCFPRDLGEAPGAPSRWVTLRALRVLRWAE
jgi:hypothetical protein